MFHASDVTLEPDEPQLIVQGRGNTAFEHEVFIRAATGDGGNVFLGGKADECFFPVPEGETLCLSVILYGSLYAEGDGTLHILQTNLDKTPA